MWFIARKTLDNSCACRCYITFGWESKWLRSDGKKGTKTKKNERMKDSKKIHWELMYITKKKEKFFSYLFNDTKIYCIPLFIATQTMPSYRLFSFRSNIAQFIISRVWLLSCHMRRERYRCASPSAVHLFLPSHFRHSHIHSLMGLAPVIRVHFVISRGKSVRNNNVRVQWAFERSCQNYIVIFANKLHKRDAIFNEQREKWNESIED